MGSKNSTTRQQGRTSDGAAAGGGSGGGNRTAHGGSGAHGASSGSGAPASMPQHLATQYSNNPRQRAGSSATASNTAAAAATSSSAAAATAGGSARQQQQQSQQRNGSAAATAAASSSNNNNNAANNNNTTTNNNNASNTTNNTTTTTTNERGVQEGQMVKILATIEASTVSYTASTQLLTFYITSTCPSLTYEIHTGVKMCVTGGTVFYMPNKPKMEPTRTALEGQQENRKITVKLDTSKLEDKEKAFNKHYQKQMPCVIVLRYRTTELRKSDSGEGEEVVVEHTEHTAVDLAEKPRRRVISQVVTAGGNAYVVENLYGADNENTPGGGEGVNEVTVGSTIVPHDGEEDEDGLCVICITNPKDTAVMPCRHMCMCKSCGEELLRHKPVCPVCRAPISTLLHMPTLSNNSASSPSP